MIYIFFTAPFLNASELPVDAQVPLPFLMPVATEASFCVGIDTGISIDMPSAAEACFLPGVPVVFAVVHGFSVRSGEMEVSFAAEFIV